MFSPKFAKLVKKDGLWKTWQRGHKAIRNTQNTGRPVLTEVDTWMQSSVWARISSATGTTRTSMLTVHSFEIDHHQRRWVEYADHFMFIGITTDRIPPGWNGWMSGTYDDPPVVSPVSAGRQHQLRGPFLHKGVASEPDKHAAAPHPARQPEPVQ